MLSFSHQTKIYLAVEPIDMRRGFDSLAAWVDQNLGRRVLDGDVFLFLSKRRDRIKVLWWDVDGYILFYKRLEVGTFEKLAHDGSAKEIVIDSTSLSMMLRGIEIGSIKKRKRFEKKAG